LYLLLDFQIEQCFLSFLENKSDSLFRLELEFVGRNEILWSSNNSSKVISPESKGQEVETDNMISLPWNLYQRTNFIDMTDLTVNSILNSYFICRVVLVGPKIDEAALAAAAKGKKGAPVVAESPDTILAEISFPLSSLLKEKSGKIPIQSSFQSLQVTQPRANFHSSLNLESSSLTLSLALDNGFLEYIALGNILQVECASLQQISYDWCIPLVIPVEKGKPAAGAKGKGKEPPSSEELKTKELQFITETLNNQSTLAQYVLTISPSPQQIQEEEQGEQWIPFPSITLSDGRLDFNKDASSRYEVTEDEPLRIHSDLWSLSWGPSSYIFFHRSTLKTLVSQLQTGAYPQLQLTIQRLLPSVPPPEQPSNTKSNSKEPQPEPLKELTATAKLDIVQLTAPDIQGISLRCSPLGDAIETSSSQPSAEISLTFTSPFVVTTSFPPSEILPVDAISLKQVNSGGLNRDVKKELRNEISAIVKEIAQEYVSLYPQPPPGAGAGNGNGNGNSNDAESSLEQRRGHFLYHLSSSGLYHRLKEILKPKIQRVVRERYGARNRALGKVEASIPSIGFEDNGQGQGQGGEGGEKVPMEEMLSELYIVLVKECNTVLNAMYKSTIVSRDTEELEKCAVIDDETETPQQKFYRLFCLCNDAEGDGRLEQAEQFHLERIQLLEMEILLNTDPQAPHHAYFQYSEYLIRRSVEELLEYRLSAASSSSPSATPSSPSPLPLSVVPERVEKLRDEAKECLAQAIVLKSNHWMSYLQLGCLLMETNQIEKAADALQTALTLQLEEQPTQQQQPRHGSRSQSAKGISELLFRKGDGNEDGNGNGNGNENSFLGYESNELCHAVHPLTHVMLALYFSKLPSPQPLQTRKAIRLAVQAFQHGDYDPPISSHGKPRRTAVLCLCQGALFLFEHGFLELASLATQFALDCDIAATKKAQERSLPAETIPFLRHLLKKTQCYAALYAQGDLQRAYELALECYGVSVSSSDLIQSNLLIAKVSSLLYTHSNSGSQGEREREGEAVEASLLAYHRAMKEAQSQNLLNLIPLMDYISLGKLLISQGRYQDALESMLHGCRIYPSSSLFNLIGICCLRLDKMIDAEDALQEANLIDHRNACVWAYLCILCLSTGGHRLEEADNCCYQALRLGLSNAGILREMTTSYIAVDKLRTAEELIRRAISCEEHESIGGKCSSYTRRLLGDILAGQNQAANAIEEYQLIIEDHEAEMPMRIQAGEKCLKLLESLGRTEEVMTLESILRSLSGEE
jgi:tetratricopeptide (TPR) repeat protein